MKTFPTIPLPELLNAEAQLRSSAAMLELHAASAGDNAAKVLRDQAAANRKTADQLFDWAWIEGIEVADCVLKTQTAPVMEAVR